MSTKLDGTIDPDKLESAVSAALIESAGLSEQELPRGRVRAMAKADIPTQPLKIYILEIVRPFIDAVIDNVSISRREPWPSRDYGVRLDVDITAEGGLLFALLRRDGSVEFTLPPIALSSVLT